MAPSGPWGATVAQISTITNRLQQTTHCWQVQVTDQGLDILGVPVGRDEYIRRQVASKIKQWTERMLVRLYDCDLPIQHKVLLLRQCVATAPSFLARNVSLSAHHPETNHPSIDDLSDTASIFRTWDDRVHTVVAAWARIDETANIKPLMIHLPLRLGGLGIRAMSIQADMYHAMSFIQSNTSHINMHGSPLIPGSATVERVRPWWDTMAKECMIKYLTTGTGRAPTLRDDRAGPLQWQKRLQTISDSRFSHHGHQGERLPAHLRFLALDVSAPSYWAATIPNHPSLDLCDVTYSTLLSSRLLVPTAPELDVCPLCSKTPRSSASHAYTCRTLNQLCTLRHDHVVDSLHLLLAAVSQKEVSFRTGAHSSLKLDLLVTTPRARIGLDVTVVAAGRSDDKWENTFRRARAKKLAKYHHLIKHNQIDKLVVLGITPFGHFSPEASDFLASVIKDKHTRQEWIRRISIDVARGTAVRTKAWRKIYFDNYNRG